MTPLIPPNSTRSGSARLTIWLCFAVAVLEGYDLQAMAIAGPAVRAAMQLDLNELGFAFSASLFGLTFGAAYGGKIADAIGRKKVLLGSLCGLGALTIATAMARDFHALVVMRILAGVAMGGVMPNLIAISAAASRDLRVTTKVAVMISGMPAGGVLASLAGHPLVARFGWQGIFVMGGITTIIVIPIVARYLVEPTIQSAQTRVVQYSWRRSLFSEGRALPTLLLWLLFIFTLAIFSTVAGWGPTLVVGKGMSTEVAYGSLMAINVGGIVGTLFISSSCDRWGMRYVMLLSYAAMALSLWLFSNSDVASSVLSLAVVLGFWMLGVQCALYGVSPRFYPPACYSTGVGSSVAAGRIGSILGPIWAGYMMAHGMAPDRLIALMSVLALAAGAVLLALTATTSYRLRQSAAAH